MGDWLEQFVTMTLRWRETLLELLSSFRSSRGPMMDSQFVPVNG